MQIILVPAYGRDYNSEQAVLDDWNKEKDFLINDVSSRWNGSYINRQQTNPGDIIKVRYNKKADFVHLNGGTPGTIRNME